MIFKTYFKLKRLVLVLKVYSFNSMIKKLILKNANYCFVIMFVNIVCNKK